MLDRYCDCCWKKKRASRAFWKPRHHIPDTILWLWILCWIKWRGTLTSPDSTGSLKISHTCTHKNHEFAQALCASWKTIVLQEACSWRHMYGEGRQPPGLAHIDRSCDWPEKTITREITSPSYLPIMIIHKSVTAALNFDQPTPTPTLSNGETVGKWWVWQISQSDTTVYGTEMSSSIFTCKNVWIHLL